MCACHDFLSLSVHLPPSTLLFIYGIYDLEVDLELMHDHILKAYKTKTKKTRHKNFVSCGVHMKEASFESKYIHCVTVSMDNIITFFSKETDTLVGERCFISTVWKELRGVLGFNIHLVVSMRKRKSQIPFIVMRKFSSNWHSSHFLRAGFTSMH